jgi:amidase
MPAADLFVASIAASRIAHGLWRRWERHDVILTPMLAAGVPLVGSADPDDIDVAARWQAMERAAPFASLANVGGVPAIAVPLATGGTLPGSVQLVGPMGADRLLVDLAGRLSAARPVVLPWGIAGLPDGRMSA